MILQNYIFKNILITSINVTIILLSMVWLVQSLRQIDLIIENGASLFDFIYISILPAPLWIMMIIPMSTLFSVLLIFNKFTNDKETLMFQLSGASIFQIIKPIFLVCILNFLIATVINFYVIPKSYGEFKSKQFELRNNISHIFLREGVFNDLQKGLTILIDKRTSKFDLEGIFIYDTRNNKKEIDIFAKNGKILLSSSGPVFQLLNGSRREIEKNGSILNELSFKNYTINISKKQTDPEFRWLDANEKSIFQLLNESELNSKVEAHFRLAYPLLTFTLPLIAIIGFLSFKILKRNLVYIISASLMIAFLIQILLVLSRSFTINNPSIWFIFYLVPTIPILLSFLFVFFQNKISSSKFLVKNNVS